MFILLLVAFVLGLRLEHWRIINTSVCVLLQEKIKEMFENLMQVEHPNIVKFHKYWLDMKESQARVCMFFFFPSLYTLKTH